VADSPLVVLHFDADHEEELGHAISNTGGTPDSDEQPRADLPPVVKTILSKPPDNFPEFDWAKPETDFQLQQALAVVSAMGEQKRSALNN